MQILFNGQLREDPPVLRNVANSRPVSLFRWLAEQVARWCACFMPDDGSISQEYVKDYKLALASFPFEQVEKSFAYSRSEEGELEKNQESEIEMLNYLTDLKRCTL